MNVFNNQQRSGYEEIASYSPKFYKSIKEMDAIFRLAGFTLDLMAGDLEGTVSNQFIDYMDEEAFSRYEAFLGVKKDINKTLEERKAYINALQIGSGKISKEKIVTIVNQFVDCTCEVVLEGSELFINMTFEDDPEKYMDDIRNLIRDKVPLHIEIVYHGTEGLNIVVILENKVTVEKMINRADFFLYGSGMVLHLDGSALLDGSITLDSRLHLFPVVDKHRLEFLTTERFTADKIHIKKNLHYLDGSLQLDGSTQLDAEEWEEDI